MTTKDHLSQLGSSDDIRSDAKLIIEHLQSLDFYGWVALLREFGTGSHRLARMFPVDRGGDILSSASAFLDLLSEQTKQLLSLAASSVLNEPTTEAATMRSILVVAAVLRLRIDASLLKRLVTRKEIESATRTSAASLLAMNRYGPPVTFWEGLEFTRHPELLPVAVTAVTSTDPSRAIRLLHTVTASQHVESTLEFPIRKLLRRLPENIALTQQDLLAFFPEWLRNKVDQILDEPEFRGRFSFIVNAEPAISAEVQHAAPYVHTESGNTEIQKLLDALNKRILSQSELLSRFAQIAPTWLRIAAGHQGRSLADVVSDLIRSGPTNLADARELATQQQDFSGLREVWVLAKHPLDLDSNFFYSAVHHNISERFIQYYYFLTDTSIFESLRGRLITDIGDAQFVNAHIHCVKVDPIAFLFNTGCGLLIPESVENMQGVLVTELTSDGRIEGGQSMPPELMRRVYVTLRSLIEAKFRRSLPRLIREPISEIEGLEQLLTKSERVN